jgi:hypothetical protein
MAARCLPSNGDSMRPFILGLNTIQDACSARAPRFRLLVGPSIFVYRSGDDGDSFETLLWASLRTSRRPKALGACGGLRPSDYFSNDGGILIDSDGHAFNRGESWRTWGSASVVLSLLTTH